MRRATTFRKFALSGWGMALTLVAAMLAPGLIPGSGMQVIASAEAIVGRPLTPVSFAGVARRTTRRAVVYGGAATAAAYTTAAVVATAPATYAAPASPTIVASPPQGCMPQGSVFVCGGYSYQPTMQGSAVVYLVKPVQ